MGGNPAPTAGSVRPGHGSAGIRPRRTMSGWNHDSGLSGWRWPGPTSAAGRSSRRPWRSAARSSARRRFSSTTPVSTVPPAGGGQSHRLRKFRSRSTCGFWKSTRRVFFSSPAGVRRSHGPAAARLRHHMARSMPGCHRTRRLYDAHPERSPFPSNRRAYEPRRAAVVNLTKYLSAHLAPYGGEGQCALAGRRAG